MTWFASALAKQPGTSASTHLEPGAKSRIAPRARLLGAEDNLVLWNRADKLLAGPNVLIHQPGRRVRQPFRQGNVLVLVGRKYLQEHAIFIAGVLDVMRHRLFDVAYIARLEIHRARVAS